MRNCRFLSLAEAEQCRVWEGYSLAGSLTVHIPVLPAHCGTLQHWQALQLGGAGSQESVSRHIPAFLGQQLSNLLPQRCPCHGKGSGSHHSIQCVPQPSLPLSCARAQPSMHTCPEGAGFSNQAGLVLLLVPGHSHS